MRVEYFARVTNVDPLIGRVRRRTRAGVSQIRMMCDRCGTVRWLAVVDLGAPHCLGGGVFLYALDRPGRRKVAR